MRPLSQPEARRRNLPHIEEPGSVYFVTFTIANNRTLDTPAKNVVFDTLRFHSGTKYTLYACVVMATHAHAVIQPLREQTTGSFYSLSQIMHSIKSYSANEINKLFGQKGSVWLAETYDRIIRDDSELKEKLGYVVNNPVKAGLVENPEDYCWLFCVGISNSLP
ncbi:REP element-mobilizing transposase RayT [Dehalogenimonas formicexedens]|uniref:REP element-mobilizing transposase RayT n=1 Tax=Dehalogenimonas formicexedens TaxID=1839801 RepID=A0A1P8F8W7_9CHLR|nr:REP element-mobilizing transposase RayT [Dehalogenimonas formicexedens]